MTMMRSCAEAAKSLTVTVIDGNWIPSRLKISTTGSRHMTCGVTAAGSFARVLQERAGPGSGSFCVRRTRATTRANTASASSSVVSR